MDELGDRSPISLDSTVEIFGTTGTVAFEGTTHFGLGTWVGIVLKDPVGKNDGSVDGVRYFKCKDKHGVFVRPSLINTDSEIKEIMEKSRLFNYELLTLIQNHRRGVNILMNDISFLERKIQVMDIMLNAGSLKEFKKDRVTINKCIEDTQATRLEIKGMVEKQNEYVETLAEYGRKYPYLRDDTHFERLVYLLKQEIRALEKKIQEEQKIQKEAETEKVKLQIEIKMTRAYFEKRKKELENLRREKEDEIRKIKMQTESILRKFTHMDDFPYEKFEKLKSLKMSKEILLNEMRKRWLKLHSLSPFRTQIELEVLPIKQPEDVLHWRTQVFLSNPEILDLRMRITPLRRLISFSKVYGGVKNYISVKLEKELVSALILSFFKQRKYEDAVETLKSMLNLKHPKALEILELDGSQLGKLLDAGLKASESYYDNLFVGEDMDEQSRSLGLNFQLEDDRNIWEEAGIENDNENNIRLVDKNQTNKMLDNIIAANINKLIERLTWEVASDQDYNKAFIMTFSSFLKPEHLFMKLVQRYHVPRDMEPKTSLLIKLRVIAAFELWLKNRSEISWRVITDIENFVKSDVEKQLSVSAKRLYKIIKKRKREIATGENLELRSYTSVSEPPKPDLPDFKIVFRPDFNLDMISELEFARQITIRNSTTYLRIKHEELVNQAWSKARLRHKAKNVLEHINGFNKFKLYVQTQIVLPEKVKDRGKKLIRFIKIANILRSLNNFDALLAIIAAINSSSISRMKYSMNEVPRNYRRMFDTLCEEMSHDNGYKRYREILNSVQGAVVPYLGMFLTDITFINEGTSEKIDGLINFAKKKQLYLTLEKIQQFQQERYNLSPIYQVQQIFVRDDFGGLNDKECYKISLEREPRGAKRSEIL